jgi:hypothetical protein
MVLTGSVRAVVGEEDQSATLPMRVEASVRLWKKRRPEQLSVADLLCG